MKRLLTLVLMLTPLVAWGQAQNFPGVPSSGGPISGPVTINNTAGGGANDMTLGILNRIHLSCDSVAVPAVPGYRFPTIEAGNSDITTNSTQGGLNDICPDNSIDTATGQNEIGSTTKVVVDNFRPGNNWTYNVSSAATYAWGIHNASCMKGENLGTIGGSRTGGAYFKYGASANTSYGIDDADGQSGSGQAYGCLENVFVEGTSTGTSGAGAPSIAMLNWEGISGMNSVENAYVFNCGATTCVRLASNNLAGSALGPLAFRNVWSNCVSNTSCSPWLITTSSGSTNILPIEIQGGTTLDAGSGNTGFSINGNGTTNIITSIHVHDHYFEYLAAGSSKMLAVADASNVHLSSSTFRPQNAGDTSIDLSQTVAGGTCSFTAEDIMSRSTANTLLNNHISTKTLSGFNYLPFYHYGGDSTCLVAPVTIDSNELDVLSRTGTMLFQFPLTGNSILTGPVQINNGSGSGTFSIGSISGVIRIDTAGGVGEEFRPLNSANGLTGFTFARTLYSETTAPGSGIANSDFVWGDSGDHTVYTNLNNTGNQPVPRRGIVTSVYTNATTTPSNITNLSFTVAASRNYTMTCDLYYQGSAATAGLDITVTGPATPTSVFYSYDEDPTSTSLQNGVASSFGTKIVGNAAVTATTNLHGHVTMGLINGTNAGTVQVQGSATGTGTVTIQVGSFCTME